MEVAFDFQFGHTQPVVENLGKETLVSDRGTSVKHSLEEIKPSINKENFKNVLVEHIKALGLCFKCGEKHYF
jgi:hypothetical protein